MGQRTIHIVEKIHENKIESIEKVDNSLVLTSKPFKVYDFLILSTFDNRPDPFVKRVVLDENELDSLLLFLEKQARIIKML